MPHGTNQTHAPFDGELPASPPRKRKRKARPQAAAAAKRAKGKPAGRRKK